MMRLITLLLLLLLPGIALAQVAGTFSALTLTPPPSDLSLIYLSNIFGEAEVLHGTGSQMLGALFGVFNSAVLVLGGIVILYTLIISTLSTAHEGEVLGKRWSSIWIPVRSVAGIALLIPKASGYSFIQIFMLWVTVQGIGAADSIWGASLDYLTKGGVIIQQNMSASSPQMTSMINNSASLLRSLTCTYMLQRQFELYSTDKGGPTPPDFYQGIMSELSAVSSSSTVTLYFPYTADNFLNTNGVCGNVQWSSPSMPSFMVNDSGEVKQQYASIQQSIIQSRTLAVQTMITGLYPTAMEIVNNFLAPDPPGAVPLGEIIDNSDPEIWGSGSPSNPGTFLLPGTILSDTAASYYGMMAPTLNLIANSVNNSQDWMNEAREDGWILAGKYYFSLVALNEGVQTFADKSAPTFNPPDTSLNTNPQVYGHLGGQSSAYVVNLQTLVNSPGEDTNLTVGEDSPFITDAISFGGGLSYGAKDIVQGYSASINVNKKAKVVLKIFFQGLNEIVGGFFDLMNAQSTNANPIVSIATIGSGFINTCIQTFIFFAVAILVLGLALGLAFGFAIAAAVVGFAVAIMGLVTPVLITLLTAGLTMALYLPIIPFIIFLFGAIGWIIAVVECIIAAPLVALGIAHPEGQEILGKAEPAVILLVNVFLRPTLMLFGLLIGMQLSYVSIWLLNEGFKDAYFNSAGQGASGFTWIFLPLGMIILYVIIVQQVIHKSFSLIHIIPDEVLKWIGGNIKGLGGEAEAERAIGGKFEGAAKQMGETTGKIGEAGMQGASQAIAMGGKAEEALKSAVSGGGGGGGAGMAAMAAC